jgi:hypothetical protein
MRPIRWRQRLPRRDYGCRAIWHIDRNSLSRSWVYWPGAEERLAANRRAILTRQTGQIIRSSTEWKVLRSERAVCKRHRSSRTDAAIGAPGASYCRIEPSMLATRGCHRSTLPRESSRSRRVLE